MPRAKKNMTSLLDSFESDTEKEHDAAVTAASKTPKKTVGGDTRATALVSMTKDEKEDLEDKLSGIDAAVRSGKKEKVKEKICGVLKFLADKGADALIVMLPYLGQMAGMISQV